MNPGLLQLQMQYANAVYQAEKWTREAAIAKDLMDQMAQQAAESTFVTAKAPARKSGSGKRASGGVA